MRFLRVAVITGLAAFVLSLLSGMIAGVGLGTVLLRAVVSALVFGVGGVAAFLSAGRFLPGLTDPGTGRASGSGEDDASLRTEARGAAAGARLNIVVEDDGSDSDEDESLSPGDENDLVEEVEEQSVDDEEAVMKSIIAAESESENSGVGEDALDEIPDIGSFAGSFVGPDDESSGEIEETGSSGGSRQGSGGKGAGNDPAHIAQALRTMMNRDK